MLIKGESALTCKWCKHATWRKRRNGKSDYGKPGLCNIVTDKRLIVNETSGCDKWEGMKP